MDMGIGSVNGMYMAASMGMYVCAWLTDFGTQPFSQLLALTSSTPVDDETVIPKHNSCRAGIIIHMKPHEIICHTLNLLLLQ
jgi:hypothetical protein